MEALEIEGQTDQTPLARRRRDPTQGELAEAEYLFDDADHRFDGAFACPVDRFAKPGSQLVGHLDLCARVLRRRVRQWREALLRARDDGDHAPSRCRAQCCASHTGPSSRDQHNRHPVRRPRVCRSRTGWPPE
jgi:hypothetical protein